VPKSLTGKNMADGMYSNDEEYVEFVQPIFLDGPVELWLRDIGESDSSARRPPVEEGRTKDEAITLHCGDVSAEKSERDAKATLGAPFRSMSLDTASGSDIFP